MNEDYLALIVDDDAPCIMALEGYLGDIGIKTISTGDSRCVWEILETRKPSLLILDVIMPEPDGFELCRMVKQSSEFRTIPVVFLTSMESIEKKVLELDPVWQPDAICYKPIKKNRLKTTILSMLRIRDYYCALEENLENLRKLEVFKDNLVNMLAHDMRHPLQSIYGYCAFLDGSLSSSMPTAELARNIKNHAYRLNQMLQNFLDVGRLESKQLPLFMEELQVGDIIKLCLDHMQSLALSREIPLETRCDQPDSVFMGDSMLLSRVLDNLLNNAIKFSHKGLPIVLGSSLDEASGDVLFTVEDRGPGVRPEHREKIFEKFGVSELQLHNDKPSVGLGLAFCKLAVKAHGGNIRVDDNPQGGSIFTIRIPKGIESGSHRHQAEVS